MNKTIKEQYLPPMIEVIEVENEGVMAGSPGSGAPSDMPGEGWINNTRSTSSRAGTSLQSSSHLQDFEDLLNDILTVRK